MPHQPSRSRQQAAAATAAVCIMLGLGGGCLDLEETPGDPLGRDAGAAGAAGSAGESGLPTVDADLSGVEVAAPSVECADEYADAYPESRELFLTMQACVQHAGATEDICAASCATTGGVPEAVDASGDPRGDVPCRACVWGFCSPLIDACFIDTGCAAMAICAGFRGVELNECTLQCAADNEADSSAAADAFISLNSCATYAVRADSVCSADCVEGLPAPDQGPNCEYPGNMNPDPACNACVKDYCCPLVGQCMQNFGCVRIGLCAQGCVD